MTSIFLDTLLFIFGYMSLWFLISVIVKRNDIADFAWGLGFITITIFLGLGDSFYIDHFLLISFLTLIWGTRLASHILRRLLKNHEDSRYLAWRQEWGKYFYIRSYLQVFLLQGLFMLLISVPSIVASQGRGLPLGILSVIGLIVWVLGFYFESTADKQLSDFVKNPSNKGTLLKSGLWNYSRHPNYFGEVTQWWGISVIAFSVSQNYLVLISPVTITVLILFISGIPLLEKKYLGRPDFEEYKKRTSIFIPWFPKKMI